MSTFPGTSTAQAVAPDDWVKNQQSAILQSFCLPDQRTFQQHMEEGAITSGSQNAKKLDKMKISESNAEHGTCMYMSHVHDHVHFFNFSALNMERTEGIKNSLSLLNYTSVLKSLHILVPTMKKN